MKNYILSACTFVSVMFFVGFATLYLYALIADPHTNVSKSPPSCPHISFGNIFKITAIKAWGGNVVFFNQVVPYTGSIVSLAGVNTVKVNGFDAPGIYFRLIKGAARTDNYWTWMISLWYPILIFSILPVLNLTKKWCAKK